MNNFKYGTYKQMIVNSPLFKNISDELIDEMLISLNAQIKSFSKNEIVIKLGETFRYSGMVLDGTIEVSYNTIQFEKLNVNHYKKGQLFGEAMALKRLSYSPIQVSAVTNCTLLLLDLRGLVESDKRCCSSCVYNHQLLLNLMDRMAEQNLFSNLKIRILSQKSLRDRIMIYLTHMQAESKEGFSMPFSQTALAEFLGVNRSALSRELGRMQDEELIIIKGRNYKIVS